MGTILLILSAVAVVAQSNPPPVSYVRSYVNDLPDRPLVTVTVTGASNVSCFTIEEILPGAATAQVVSGDGVLSPSLNVIRWGPYFNTVSATVSYRLTGMPAGYLVSGGAWVDGAWYFSPGVTTVNVLEVGGVGDAPIPPPQVATPVFNPAGGAVVPTNVTISCSTTGAALYYTLDGSVPTTSSLLYTGAVAVAQNSGLRARAFTNGYLPSVVRSDSYGLLLTNGSLTVLRVVDATVPAAPLVQLSLMPTGATCFAVEESLPPGLTATNVTGGGSFVASNNVVRWGPFFGTNAQIVSYQATGLPGSYPVRATWSVDGMAGSETAGTNVVVAVSSLIEFPATPPQVTTPVFTPPSGSNVPVSLTLTCATPGALIYYTLDGSVPTTGSLLYTGAVNLALETTVLARAFTNGWMPSAASVAYYGLPAPPADAQLARSVDVSSNMPAVVTLSLLPGAGASCIAVTEELPPGLTPTNLTEGGNYIASNNVVVWGPFFGANARTLSYQAMGRPGNYPTRVTWSVDGVSESEPATATIAVASGVSTDLPSPPLQTPTPILTPSIASGLPVNVSVSCGDPQAQIHFTTDGSLPTPSSLLYATPLMFNSRTTLRVRAFRAGYLPSVAAVGEFVEAPTTNLLLLVRSVFGSGTFIPTVTLTATPTADVKCYAVTESIAPGLTPSGLATNAVWDASSRTVLWGPYLDNQPRELTYYLSGSSGTFPLAGEGSFDGHSASASGVTTVNVNAQYSGAPNTNFYACVTETKVYQLNFNPNPGIITIDSISGTLDWGDGTQTNVTQPVMNFGKLYANPGIYVLTLSVDWTGHTVDMNVSGHSVRTDTNNALSQCNPPVIVSPPADLTVLAGARAEFIVDATSFFPMSYQWFFNVTNPIVSPASLATLTLENVGFEAEGLYSVLVTNAYGAVTSSPAALDVIMALVTGVNRAADGSVTLDLEGLPNSTTRIWAATNLEPPIFWQPISTNAIGPGGTVQFTDTDATNYPARFYRFSTP